MKAEQLNCATLSMREAVEDSPAKLSNSECQGLKTKAQSWGSLWPLQIPRKPIQPAEWVNECYKKVGRAMMVKTGGERKWGVSHYLDGQCHYDNGRSTQAHLHQPQSHGKISSSIQNETIDLVGCDNLFSNKLRDIWNVLWSTSGKQRPKQGPRKCAWLLIRGQLTSCPLNIN